MTLTDSPDVYLKPYIVYKFELIFKTCDQYLRNRKHV